MRPEQREGGETLLRASVCLHSRAAAARTSVAPSGSASTHTPSPPFYPVPLPSPVFLFTCGSLQQLRSLLVRGTKMERIEREEWIEGGGGGRTKGLFLAHVDSTHVV